MDWIPPNLLLKKMYSTESSDKRSRIAYKSRHQDFHQRKPVRNPLVGIYCHSIYPMADMIRFFPQGKITPDDIDTSSWLQVYEDVWRDSGLMWGDLVHWASPLNGFPWMEAIAGCPVYVSKESKSIWVDAPPDFQHGTGLRRNLTNRWFEKLLQATESVVSLSSGRFPVAPGIMRGISDMMVAILGHNDFYTGLKDNPQRLLDLAYKLADLWIEVIEAQYRLIPKFDEGYVNAGLWLQGYCPVYQEDAAALISERDFEEVIGPAARSILEAFEYPIMHLHSTGLHLTPHLLNSNQNITIEVNIDPTGPSVENLIPIFEKINATAPIEIFGTEDEIRTCMKSLPSSGTAYLILEASPEN